MLLRRSQLKKFGPGVLAVGRSGIDFVCSISYNSGNSVIDKPATSDP